MQVGRDAGGEGCRWGGVQVQGVQVQGVQVGKDAGSIGLLWTTVLPNMAGRDGSARLAKSLSLELLGEVIDLRDEVPALEGGMG